jgi:RNA polymerase sigma-70 factor (ECF subfamily)
VRQNRTPTSKNQSKVSIAARSSAVLPCRSTWPGDSLGAYPDQDRPGTGKDCKISVSSHHSQYREFLRKAVILPAISCDRLAGNRMTAETSEDITRLLAAWNKGDENALKDLIPLVYPELRKIARQRLGRRSPDQTLESAALANEAYLRLIRARGLQCRNRAHFFALCAQMIRRILVDHARNHQYAKRGGGAVRVPLNEALLGTRARGVEMLALDEALTALSKIDRRKGRVVELRYFGGLSVEESAEVLQISPQTVMRDWRTAKVWLFQELSGIPHPSSVPIAEN